MHEEMHITQMQFMNTGAREIVSFLDTTLWGSVATYPSAGGRRVTRGCVFQRKEYARSRHQRLFEENVRKTGKHVVYEL